jgi:hypothetical protein
MRFPPPPARAILLLLLAAFPAAAASPLRVAIGPSRDGPAHDLQHKVDALVGTGRVDVRSDYVGARPGDPDPWSWTNTGEPMTLHLVDRRSPGFVVGWYAEGPVHPSPDGPEQVLGGVVLDNGRKRGATVVFRVPGTVRRFGLFVADTDDPGAAWTRHRTNRTLNPPGPDGAGAAHEPWDGDVQLLVFDVSRWLGRDTWLVAGEISDTGRRVGHGADESDNDYSDVLFTVTGASATPAVTTTFGRVKSLFR